MLFRVGLVGCLWIASLGVSVAAGAATVHLATIAGSINPASADYLIHAIERAEQDEAAALLIELDTPGGLVSSTKDIIQAMLGSTVPVIVYVTPSGAWAASAGTFITVAANVAAMAPGTSIGAAHPVGIGGGSPTPPAPTSEDAPSSAPRDHAAEKAENIIAAFVESIAIQRGRNGEWVVDAVRNSVAIDADEALELGVVDIVAPNRRALFAAIEGREIEIEGETRTLALEGANVVPVEMTLLQKLFNVLADPNLAVILLLGAGMGLYAEFNSPGLIIPGVLGGVCLVLLGISLQILPFSWVGLILMAAGLGLFVAEIFVSSFGLLFALGVACFLLGGTMVFDQPELLDLRVSFWSVLVPAVAAAAAVAAVVIFAVGRSMTLAPTAGVDELMGLVGHAAESMAPEGRVFIRGEYWNAVAETPVTEGEAVRVTAVEGLKLRVRRTES